jgi:hypothetical protein
VEVLPESLVVMDWGGMVQEEFLLLEIMVALLVSLETVVLPESLVPETMPLDLVLVVDLLVQEVVVEECLGTKFHF